MNEYFSVDGLQVELQRNRRRRSRIAVTVTPAGHVLLEAPMHTLSSDAEALVKEHARWLRYRVNEVLETTAGLGTVGYQVGDVALYLGQPLQLTTWSGYLVEQEANLLKVPESEDGCLRSRVRQWYTDQARLVLGQVLNDFSHLPWLEGQLPPWRHRFMTSQWGSCSASGRLSLNTHLIKLDRSLIEYVVLHELCHLKHHDHSRRFHALVDMYMPDAAERGKALRKCISVLLD